MDSEAAKALINSVMMLLAALVLYRKEEKKLARYGSYHVSIMSFLFFIGRTKYYDTNIYRFILGFCFVYLWIVLIWYAIKKKNKKVNLDKKE